MTPPHFHVLSMTKVQTPVLRAQGIKLGIKIQDDATKSTVSFKNMEVPPPSGQGFKSPPGLDATKHAEFQPPSSADRFINLIYN